MRVNRTGTLDRRHVLAGFGILGVSRLLPACGSEGDGGTPPMGPAAGTGLPGSPDEGTCVLTPAQIEGPFFFDTGLVRRDIRDGKSGVALQLGLRVVDADTCAPLEGALVEVWHADAEGVYSAFDAAQGNTADAAGETFLRGFQTTDADGRVEFLTIYPGWYPGRTPHIHLMVRLEDRRELLTTQLYFPEAVTDAVYRLEPYAARGVRTTTNATDVVGVPPELLGAFTEEAGGYGTAFRMVVPPA